MCETRLCSRLNAAFAGKQYLFKLHMVFARWPGDSKLPKRGVPGVLVRLRGVSNMLSRGVLGVIGLERVALGLSADSVVLRTNIATLFSILFAASAAASAERGVLQLSVLLAPCDTRLTPSRFCMLPFSEVAVGPSSGTWRAPRWASSALPMLTRGEKDKLER